MQLHEICDHPWFRNNAAIRPVITLESTLAQAEAAGSADAGEASGAASAAANEITRMSKNITIEGNIDNVDYQVISKPQHAQNLLAAGQDGAAAGSAQNQR